MEPWQIGPRTITCGPKPFPGAWRSRASAGNLEAVVPLELDFEVTEGQLAPGVAGGACGRARAQSRARGIE